ncbi:MAG: hypothetical protein JO307_15640 [Bryobacterales bacterium]|nr:hypothetical protein [Bryobacterales bacterium]
MKAQKALKRLNKIDALLANLIDGFNPTSDGLAELLSSAQEAIARAKEAVKGQVAGSPKEAVKTQFASSVSKKPPAHAMLHGQAGSKTAGVSPQPKRLISAASRRRMALAQKKRWAAIKAGSEISPKRPKRRISPEGMKRIIAATKKYWAQKRSEEAEANRVAAKKAS